MIITIKNSNNRIIDSIGSSVNKIYIDGSIQLENVTNEELLSAFKFIQAKRTQGDHLSNLEFIRNGPNDIIVKGYSNDVDWYFNNIEYTLSFYPEPKPEPRFDCYIPKKHWDTHMSLALNRISVELKRETAPFTPAQEEYLKDNYTEKQESAYIQMGDRVYFILDNKIRHAHVASVGRTFARVKTYDTMEIEYRDIDLSHLVKA